MIGPLLRLRLTGFLCPWLEDDQEHEGRVAAFSLQSIPIRWYRKVRKAPKSFSDGVMDEISDYLMGDPSTTYVPFLATMSVTDTDSGPAIEVLSDNLRHAEYEFEDDATQQNILHLECENDDREKVILVIPLHEVDTVAKGTGWEGIGTGACDCQVKVFGLPAKEQLLGSGRKLLQFDVLGQNTMFHSVSYEDVISHLNAMVEWNRVRLVKEEERAYNCYGCNEWMYAMSDDDAAVMESGSMFEEDQQHKPPVAVVTLI